jgi:hypothetical protein
MVTQAASYVRRARAGDENAMAMLYRIGEEARKGNPRVTAAFAACKEYIDRNPAQPFVLGAEPPIVADSPKQAASTALVVDPPKVNPELRKPVLPRGIFDRLFDPDYFAVVIVRACQYRNGLPAAAAVLAAGPTLTNPVIHELGVRNFGTDEPAAIFFHGVKFSGEDAWSEVAPHLDIPLRRCLAVGQCIGRARKIQALRQPNSRISQYSEVAGWELGE